MEVASSSVLDHVPDPGPELRDPRINSRTVSKITKVKKHEEKQHVPVSTPNAPADDPCQLPTATFALRKSFSFKNILQPQILPTLTTMGPPLSPSQLSWPPELVPAHTKMFGIHSF